MTVDVPDPADPSTLLGTWRFVRQIEDRRNAERGRVTGTMTLTPEGTRIRWSEHGILEWRNTRNPAYRTLFLVPRPDGWFVTFEDGRDFHPWRPGTQVRHPCGSDLYTGRIETEAERWSVSWTVTGPRKDYTMTTEIAWDHGATLA